MALNQAEDTNLKIALIHHPFDWLREFNRDDSEALLLDNCNFVLHGHLHRASMNQLVSPDKSAMIIAGGACYETRDYPNSYNLVQLDFPAGTGTVYLRRYTDARGGFWAKDALTYRNVPDGEYTFALCSDSTPISRRSSAGDTSASQQEQASASSRSSKYTTNIKHAQGVVIGDNAQVTQHFGGEPKHGRQPNANVRNSDQRCIDLAANIRETLELINEYESQRRLTDDPKEKRRVGREISDLRTQLVVHEEEYQRLDCRQLEQSETEV